MTARALMLAAVVVVATVVAACSVGTTVNRPSTAQPLAEGQTIGGLDRAPGGTAVLSNVRSLLAASCASDTLLVRTTREVVQAKMDCTRNLPEARYQPFLGQPVVITYAAGRLRLESPTAGVIDLPVSDATVTDTSATP